MTAATSYRYVGNGTKSEIFNIINNEVTVIFAGDGTDYIYAYDKSDFLYGQGGRDFIRGGDGPNDLGNVIFGDYGVNDSNSFIPSGFTQAGAGDIIHAGSGNDVVYASAGQDYVNGENGNDWISGGVDRDVIYGGNGADTMYGDDGDDIIWGGSPAAVAGAGTYPAYGPLFAGAAITYDWNGITDAAAAGTAGNSFGSSGSADTSADYIDGGNGADYLLGLGGDDTVMGGDGADLCEGNDGNDTVAGGKGADYLYGNDGNDWIEGNDGADVILGGNGNDRIEGGGNNDYIVGQKGYDLLFGNAGSDTFEFHKSDIVSGIWSTVADFGSTTGNFDSLLIEGFGANLAYYQDGANTLIYAADIGLVGGIIVQNITIAALQPQVATV